MKHFSWYLADRRRYLQKWRNWRFIRRAVWKFINRSRFSIISSKWFYFTISFVPSTQRFLHQKNSVPIRWKASCVSVEEEMSIFYKKAWKTPVEDFKSYNILSLCCIFLIRRTELFMDTIAGETFCI